MRKIKLSIAINFLIVFFTIIASIVMFTGFKFMPDSLMLQDTYLSMFKFFTVDSNILMGICAFIFIIYEIKYLRKKIKEIPKSIYILKLIATTGVSLTFLVVFGYLGLFTGYLAMIENANLFFHLLIPVLSIITYVFFEKNNLEYKYSLMGIIPTLLYEVYYISNILVHVENNKVSPMYDWYWFVQGGLYLIFLVAPVMLIISAIISAILLKGNKVFNK